MRIEIDFTKEIKEALANEEGSEDVISDEIWAAEQNKGKKLNKPFRTSGGPKKFSVYVKNEKGNVVKVNFGDPNMEIKRDDPARRKSFRARHGCDNPGPKTKAKYWSCKMWSKKSVTKVTKGSVEEDLLHDLDESESALSEKQKKLPPEIQKQILKKKGQKPSDKKEDKKEEKSEAEETEAKRGLWDNIHKKRQRIKDGSGEKMRKKGDKGAPSEKQIKQAQKKKEEAKAEHGQKKGEEFKPHKMYDKNGKAYEAKTYQDHLKMKKMGYTFEKPA